MHIKLLDEKVSSRIAAGEVIDRPASIVRELIDNAVDAGADAIDIYIIDGGIKSIKVIDNGCGIPKDELKLALEKHSTSKISDVDDLFAISTMGFRGEALYSIKTVANMRLISKYSDNPEISGFQVDGNSEIGLKPVARKRGTTVEVNDLFYNLPARRKFLKSRITEYNQVKKIVIEKILSHTDIAFRFYHDDKKVFVTSGDADFENIFFSVYPQSKNIRIHSYDYEFSDSVRVKIEYTPQADFFNNRKFQQFYVNKRPIQASFFYGAIEQGYREFISVNRYPLLYCYLEIDPNLVDINIHPAKREVKFYDQQEIFRAIKKAVQLSYSELLKDKLKNDTYKINNDIHYASDNSFDFTNSKSEERKSLFDDEKFYGNKNISSTDSMNSKIQSDNLELDYKIYGTLFNTYIIVESDGVLRLIDQHAVSEGIWYRIQVETFNEKDIENLLVPMVLDLGNVNDNLEKKIEHLTKRGYDIEFGEGNSIVIRALPSLLVIRKDYTAVLELIANYLEDDDFDEDYDIVDRFLIEISCKNAVKKGDLLSLVEMDELVKEYFESNITHCPHGRPTAFILNRDELDKFFQRRL